MREKESSREGREAACVPSGSCDLMTACTVTLASRSACGDSRTRRSTSRRPPCPREGAEARMRRGGPRESEEARGQGRVRTGRPRESRKGLQKEGMEASSPRQMAIGWRADGTRRALTCPSGWEKVSLLGERR